MSLPTYDKSKRKKSFQALPKGAYVIKILQAKEQKNKNNSGRHLEIIFDIAEGEYRDFYRRMYETSTNEDKKYSPDAYYRITIPEDSSQSFVWDNWNTFFADLEDSNNGFVFAGNVADLRGKVIGGKFHIEQTEYNGNVYDHTRLRWTCVAEDVRTGKYGQLPKDKLISSSSGSGVGPDGFMKAPTEAADVPFL